MNLYDSKSSFYIDSKRTTMFPSLKKNMEPRAKKPRELLNLGNLGMGYSMDEKRYRMTSNQMIKGLLKKNDSQINKLRTTFLKQNNPYSMSKKKIGQYEVVKEIGKGGFAQVYEVLDEKGQRYALKQYNLQTALECYNNQANIGGWFFEKGEIKKQFQEEEGSENLIRFVQKFRIGKNGYIVQQLADQNMSKIVSDIQGIFQNTERIYQVRFKEFYRQLASCNYLQKIMVQLCRVIGMINRQGYIHCDLKLENLMVQLNGDVPTVKLIDFGSTFQYQYGLPKITITPEYMPPQLLLMLENGSNDHEMLKNVDVWSIGCILLELLTGIPLWFRYKCKVELKGRAVAQLGFFALTGRDYTKIIRKQKEIVENMGRIPFTMKEFQKYRPILKRLLVLNPGKRIALEDCIKLLQQLD